MGSPREGVWMENRTGSKIVPCRISTLGNWGKEEEPANIAENVQSPIKEENQYVESAGSDTKLYQGGSHNPLYK